MVRAGVLRHRITIQEDTGTINKVGQKTATWTTLATEWAREEGLSGIERFAAQQVVAQLSYKVTIRFRSDINETHRILLASGALLDIQSVLDPDGRRRELQILCIERGQ